MEQTLLGIVERGLVCCDEPWIPPIAGPLLGTISYSVTDGGKVRKQGLCLGTFRIGITTYGCEHFIFV
jgi:hypothetical protein